MKDVLALTRAISNEEFFNKMFDQWGTEKNLLFVSPQLSGKHLYKYLLPYLCLVGDTELNDENEKVPKAATAITCLKRFDYFKQLLGFEVVINDDMITWADFVIFPFTTQPLVDEIYTRIRELHPECKIIFSVDFNLWEISDKNPMKEIFADENVVSDIEDNMYFSDMVIVTNIELYHYIYRRFEKLAATKYKNAQGYMGLAAMPLMVDSEILLKNVDYETIDPSSIRNVVLEKKVDHPPEVTDKISHINEAAEKVSEDFLKQKELLAQKKQAEFEARKAEQEAKDKKPEPVTEPVTSTAEVMPESIAQLPESPPAPQAPATTTKRKRKKKKKKKKHAIRRSNTGAPTKD